MLISNLKATAALIRAIESNLFLNESDDDLIELKYERAIQELTWDVSAVLNYSIDSSEMQAMLDSEETYFQNLLALKQIILNFIEIGNIAVGTENHFKLSLYQKEYAEKLKNIVNFKGSTIPNTVSRPIKR